LNVTNDLRILKKVVPFTTAVVDESTVWNPPTAIIAAHPELGPNIPSQLLK